jgi:hypothetical protein
MHLENPPSPRLKETIRYLDRLRYSNSFEESLTSAAAGGFVQLDFLTWDEDDFILDTASISPPPECSWLRPGMTFSGFQRAASGASIVLPQQGLTSSSNDPIIVNGSDQSRISVQTANGRRYFASHVYNIVGGKDENWPVKVTIHNINTQDMTLSGTMEAYNIPDKTSPSHDAHIVTFLEGEIIDFNTHTLETKNFKADAEIDSTYWRELQPFKNLTDEEMTRNLVSRKWITEQLCKGWILMRWKGASYCAFYQTHEIHANQSQNDVSSRPQMHGKDLRYPAFTTSLYIARAAILKGYTTIPAAHLTSSCP